MIHEQVGETILRKPCRQLIDESAILACMRQKNCCHGPALWQRSDDGPATEPRLCRHLGGRQLLGRGRKKKVFNIASRPLSNFRCEERGRPCHFGRRSSPTFLLTNCSV